MMTFATKTYLYILYIFQFSITGTCFVEDKVGGTLQYNEMKELNFKAGA